MGRARAFALTWVSYATYYFARKNFPVAKRTIQTELGISTAGLPAPHTPLLAPPALRAALHPGSLAAYAFGQFAGGWLGDKIGSRRLVGYGMILSAILISAFGAS